MCPSGSLLRISSSMDVGRKIWERYKILLPNKSIMLYILDAVPS
jgi:hypothetical protein